VRKKRSNFAVCTYLTIDFSSSYRLPKNEAELPSRLIGYKVYYGVATSLNVENIQRRCTSTDLQLTLSNLATSTQLIDLSPGTTYVVCVDLILSDGQECSEYRDTIKTVEIPAAPVNFEAHAVSQSEVTLVWDLLNATEVHIHKYLVELQTLSSPGIVPDQQYEVLAPMRNLTVVALVFNTTYAFTVTAVTEFGPSRPSATLLVKTAPKLPPPQEARVKKISATAAEVVWKPPLASVLTLDIIGYEISWEPGEEYFGVLSGAVSLNSTTYSLSNLRPGTDYFVAVAAVANTGVGNFCPKVHISTCTGAFQTMHNVSTSVTYGESSFAESASPNIFPVAWVASDTMFPTSLVSPQQSRAGPCPERQVLRISHYGATVGESFGWRTSLRTSTGALEFSDCAVLMFAIRPASCQTERRCETSVTISSSTGSEFFSLRFINRTAALEVPYLGAESIDDHNFVRPRDTTHTAHISCPNLTFPTGEWLSAVIYWRDNVRLEHTCGPPHILFSINNQVAGCCQVEGQAHFKSHPILLDQLSIEVKGNSSRSCSAWIDQVKVLEKPFSGNEYVLLYEENFEQDVLRLSRQALDTGELAFAYDYSASKVFPSGCHSKFINLCWELIEQPKNSMLNESQHNFEALSTQQSMVADSWANPNPNFTQTHTNDAGLRIDAFPPSAFWMAGQGMLFVRPDVPGKYVFELQGRGVCKLESGKSTTKLFALCNMPPSPLSEIDFIWSSPKQSCFPSVKIYPGNSAVGHQFDIDGDAVTFGWKLLSAPKYSRATNITDGRTHAHVYVDKIGIYTVMLAVTDGCSVQTLDIDFVVSWSSSCTELESIGPCFAVIACLGILWFTFRNRQRVLIDLSATSPLNTLRNACNLRRLWQAFDEHSGSTPCCFLVCVKDCFPTKKSKIQYSADGKICSHMKKSLQSWLKTDKILHKLSWAGILFEPLLILAPSLRSNVPPLSLSAWKFLFPPLLTGIDMRSSDSLKFLVANGILCTILMSPGVCLFFFQAQPLWQVIITPTRICASLFQRQLKVCNEPGSTGSAINSQRSPSLVQVPDTKFLLFCTRLHSIFLGLSDVMLPLSFSTGIATLMCTTDDELKPNVHLGKSPSLQCWQGVHWFIASWGTVQLANMFVVGLLSSIQCTELCLNLRPLPQFVFVQSLARVTIAAVSIKLEISISQKLAWYEAFLEDRQPRTTILIHDIVVFFCLCVLLFLHLQQISIRGSDRLAGPCRAATYGAGVAAAAVALCAHAFDRNSMDTSNRSQVYWVLVATALSILVSCLSATYYAQRQQTCLIYRKQAVQDFFERSPKTTSPLHAQAAAYIALFDVLPPDIKDLSFIHNMHAASSLALVMTIADALVQKQVICNNHTLESHVCKSLLCELQRHGENMPVLLLHKKVVKNFEAYHRFDRSGLRKVIPPKLLELYECKAMHNNRLQQQQAQKALKWLQTYHDIKVGEVVLLLLSMMSCGHRTTLSTSATDVLGDLGTRHPAAVSKCLKLTSKPALFTCYAQQTEEPRQFRVFNTSDCLAACMNSLKSEKTILHRSKTVVTKILESNLMQTDKSLRIATLSILDRFVLLQEMQEITQRLGVLPLLKVMVDTRCSIEKAMASKIIANMGLPHHGALHVLRQLMPYAFYSPAESYSSPLPYLSIDAQIGALQLTRTIISRNCVPSTDRTLERIISCTIHTSAKGHTHEIRSTAVSILETILLSFAEIQQEIPTHSILAALQNIAAYDANENVRSDARRAQANFASTTVGFGVTAALENETSKDGATLVLRRERDSAKRQLLKAVEKQIVFHEFKSKGRIAALHNKARCSHKEVLSVSKSIHGGDNREKPNFHGPQLKFSLSRTSNATKQTVYRTKQPPPAGAHGEETLHNLGSTMQAGKAPGTSKSYPSWYAQFVTDVKGNVGAGRSPADKFAKPSLSAKDKTALSPSSDGTRSSLRASRYSTLLGRTLHTISP